MLCQFNAKLHRFSLQGFLKAAAMELTWGFCRKQALVLISCLFLLYLASFDTVSESIHELVRTHSLLKLLNLLTDSSGDFMFFNRYLIAFRYRVNHQLRMQLLVSRTDLTKVKIFTTLISLV